jgi:cell division protein FtsN
MTERDDFSEALELAKRDEVTPEQVRRLALALAPVYGAAIATGTASASASSASAAAGASGTSVAGTAGSAAASVIATKAIVATLTVAAIGVASFGVLRSATPVPQRELHSPRVAPMTAPARNAEPSAIEPGLEPPTGAPAPAVLEPSMTRPARALAPRKDTPVEAQLLTQAHAALRDEPARALRIANEHRARFPHGALAQERELLAIRALEHMGRAREAAARRARALRELPGSVALERSGPLEP